MAFTFGNAKTFLQDWDRLNSSARGVRNQTKICNDANRAFHGNGKYDFDRRRARLSFAAKYTTGTVSISAGGTTVTGSGTTFTSADVGKFIRFNGEDLAYEIATYSSGTSITIESGTYLGTSNLSAVTYVLTQERKALPSDFRDLVNPTLDQLNWKLEPIEFNDLLQYRQNTREVGSPRHYSIEWVETSSGVPEPYIWVYPAPSVKHSIEYMYYAWPAEVSSDSDTFQVPLQYEPILREYMKAYLYQEQGIFDKFTTQLAIANDMGTKALRNSRGMDEHRRRQEWSPCVDHPDYVGDSHEQRLAPGEPFYL